MITISAGHNQARLAGSRAFMDTGTGVAKIAFYASARVASTETPLTAPITEIPLQNPSGVVDVTGYSLLQADDGLNMTTGVAVWARAFTRSGAVHTDFDVRDGDDDPEVGEILIESTTLYAGGATRIVSAKLT